MGANGEAECKQPGDVNNSNKNVNNVEHSYIGHIAWSSLQ